MIMSPERSRPSQEPLAYTILMHGLWILRIGFHSTHIVLKNQPLPETAHLMASIKPMLSSSVKTADSAHLEADKLVGCWLA